MEGEPELPESVSVPLTWVGIDELPVFSSNQMVFQVVAPEEFVLTFG
jgi:hypothetical protein